MKLHKYRPELEKGNAVQFIREKALPYLEGEGLDIGCSRWKIKPEAIGTDIVKKPGVDLVVKDWAKSGIPPEKYDYIFSAHCLEHIPDWQGALQGWIDVVKPKGIIFLYLPHAAAYNRWSRRHMPKHHKHDFDLPIVKRALFNRGVKITDSGYDEYAGLWAVGIKDAMRLF
jgi:predicted SAM-dependent methyltransferase